jgi:pimeloyl-ACP methyl ester carboxylesterase
MAPSNTTVIFVPGAWHTPDCFSPVTTLLEQTGYTIDLISLASVGPSKHVKDQSDDIALIRSAIKRAAERGHKCVLLGHSYGGIPGAQAIKGLEPHIQNFFLCCSFIIPAGKSLIAAFGGDLPWFQISDDKMEVNPATPAETFYNDMTEEQVKNAVAKLKPHSYQTFHAEVTYEGWRHVPTTYLYCLKDQAIPMFVQKMMVEEFAKGVDVKAETVDASHSPFVSMPEETAKAIRRAAGENV